MAARCFSLEARCKCYQNSSFASCISGCGKRAQTLWFMRCMLSAWKEEKECRWKVGQLLCPM